MEKLIAALRVNGRNCQTGDLLFVSDPAPEFSWEYAAGAPVEWVQRAYRITAAVDSEKLAGTQELLWDSGWVDSASNLPVRWAGKPLTSRQHVVWQLELRRADGKCVTAGPAEFEIALQQNSDWAGAEWIYFDGNNPAAPAPAPYFRHGFTAGGKTVRQARLYAAVRGLAELQINGQKVGRDFFIPGWCDFNTEIQYVAYDVTDMISCGQDNVIGAILGDGWYCGYFAGHRRNIYGTHPELLLRLEVKYADGSSQTVVSNASWKCATGPILYSDLYDGELYDGRYKIDDFACCGFDDSTWRHARVSGVGEETAQNLMLKLTAPVRQIMEIKPVRWFSPHPGYFIWDFGQNFAGWVRIKVKGWGGQLYTLRFAEMLNEDGSLYNLNYRSARVTDYFFCADSKEPMQSWEPHFTFHGFRYVQIDGVETNNMTPDELEVTGIVLHNEMEPLCDWECGVPELNRLFKNIQWGQRSNFLEVPTDCPQRDERWGWTGDAQIFVKTAATNMDVQSFFRKWLHDVAVAQKPDGSIPATVPNLGSPAWDNAAAWSDAAVICPWSVYQAYGSKMMLAEEYDCMRRWVDLVNVTSDDFIRPVTKFGDWLALSPVETPSELIGTAYFARCAGIIADSAAVLGKSEDEKHYRELQQKVIAAFRKKFLDNDGKLNVPTQTACALALHFGLLNEEQVRINADLLTSLIRSNGTRLDTGFVGTGCLLPALAGAGEKSLAVDLLLQTEYPSWLFSVLQGATTMWERWNSYTKKDGFGKVTMNSFNHYAYGAVGEYMVDYAAGIRLKDDVAGGQEVIIAPHADPRLKFIRCRRKTAGGEYRVFWEFTNDNLFRMDIVVPVNCTAQLQLPDGAVHALTAGEYSFELPAAGL